MKAKVQSIARRAFPFFGAEFGKGSLMQSLIEIELDIHRRNMRERTPENPALHGYKCYSQFDEDGIIARINSVLGLANGTFVEFGAGNGIENNTHLLLLGGWRGVWIDAGDDNARNIRANLPMNTRRLAFDSSFITRANVKNVITRGMAQIGGGEIDLLNMDLDGNDAYLIEEILTQWQPKTIVAEYNGKLPFGLRMTVPYRESSWRQGDDYYGASLSELMARMPGYRLICCGLSGVNAYFVRQDLAGAFPAYPPQDLYQPGRNHLQLFVAGSRPSLKFLAQSLTENPG